MEKIIERSCYGLENCENEGLVRFLGGEPLNMVIYNMCRLHLSRSRKVDCYIVSFGLIPKLKRKTLLQGYEGTFLASQVKSYLLFARRTCEIIRCPLRKSGDRSIYNELEECDGPSAGCWDKLCKNLKEELPIILNELAIDRRRL